MTNKNRIFSLFLIYMVLITILTFFYDYPETLLKRPQSFHNWRQCDGASLALNYYQEGMHFFRPQTHMLYSDDLTTGYTAPSEIPILYYFVAILYKIFGYHEFIFRALNLLIFYIGLFYLFRLADLILGDILYATVVTVLVFSAPVLVYYANNFMPNTVALSFSFIGWYYFYKYYLNKGIGDFAKMVLFFGIASCMKITELTGPVIAGGLLVLDRIGIIKADLQLRKNFWLKAGMLSSIFLFVFGWVIYAKHYNALHSSTQFSTGAYPLWELSKDTIEFIFHKMDVIWFREYYYPATFWFMIGCLVSTVVLWKRSNIILRWVSLAMAIAFFAFSILWFDALGDHDYFYIGFYVLPAMLFINIFHIIKNSGLNKINLTIIRLVFLSVMILNIYYARGRHNERYTVGWKNDYEQKKDLYAISPWLKEAGFSKEDTVIFCYSRYIRPLYLMNMKGWVIYSHDSATNEIMERDSRLMSLYSTNGARYLFTDDIKSAASYEPLQPYLKDLYANYNSIFIFRLPPQQENFNPSDSLFIQSLKM